MNSRTTSPAAAASGRAPRPTGERNGTAAMQTHRVRIDRRGVLAGGLSAGLGLAFGGPASATALFGGRQQADDEGPVLVCLQLAGGNDGLSTVVPHGDDLYHAARDTTRVAAGDVLPIDDYRGFHPLLPGLHRLYERGELAIVEGVGYPSPNRSHFASFDIWHAASLRGKSGGDGWLARLARELGTGAASDANLAVHVGDRLPYSLYSPAGAGVCFRDPDRYRWNHNAAAICDTVEEGAAGSGAGERMDMVRSTFLQARDSSAAIRAAVDAYEPRVEYPDTALGYSMSVVAALIQQRVGARILSVELAGFDTHANQRVRQEARMRTWDPALEALLADLRGTPTAKRVVVLVFSEFGRRVAENGSVGTDHGTAGPVFVAGPAVKGGLYGAHPSLEPSKLDQGDLVFGTDFRSVYATLIQDWFQRDAAALLGDSWPTLPLLA